MLPSILAKQLEEGIGEYIDTTFPMTNSPFKGSIQKMLKEHPEAVYRDPYIAVRLPFRVAESMPSCFQSIHMKFKPYVHQDKAFERLTGKDGRSTLIATGTGSGKTECFLYPILEYCYQHRGEPGIKALIIYPMNALATDQARRIAELIYNSPELNGNVTAGMYVGEGKEKADHQYKPSRIMTEKEIITDHDTMLNQAPDILLTNYKMLDYLLVRPKDANLWRDNRPETLKYIAVDELHTFDGAQGTDLACLLRRLKARLGIMGGYLCCVGTSATMGNKDSAKDIREYAENIFGEPFEKDSVITEDRISAQEFLSGSEITDFTFPSQEQVLKLEKDIRLDDHDSFIKDACNSWISEFDQNPLSIEGRINLSKKLLHNSFFQAVITLMEGNYNQIAYIIDSLKGQYPQLAELGAKSETAVNALFSLISEARTGDENSPRPFLTVQVQLWLRELRRIEASVNNEQINYAIAHDLNKQQARHYLPVVNCRDCGATGWVSYADENHSVEMKNLPGFYQKFFDADSGVVMMYPYDEGQAIPKGVAKGFLCPECLHVEFNDTDNKEKKCENCGTEMIPVLIPNPNKTTGSKTHKQYVCPFCGSHRGISLMGVRSATETSASISQMFSSRFNDDKKTLAFSDNVQDAAHRAGFFNARTWRFGLRSAIQKYAMSFGEHQSLEEFTNGFLDYWENKQGLSKEEFVSRFIAPNMTWMRTYEDMISNRKLGDDQHAKDLIEDIKKRLSYEIMLEYGLASNIGRTLEKSGCSTTFFDQVDIHDIAENVQQRVVNELDDMKDVSLQTFEIMVTGFLNTMRKNGTFDDSVYYPLIRNDFENFLLVPNRNGWRWLPGLQSGRNTPRFIAGYLGKGKGKRANFDHTSDRKYIEWIKKCHGDLSETTSDLYEAVTKIILTEAVKNGIVKKLPSSAEYEVYGLNKNKIYISVHVKQMRCSNCGSIYPVAEENMSLWNNVPCSRFICFGSLAEDKNAALNYYGKLYSTGDIVRVNAREHTGLLGREERERLEDDFKRSRAERMSWDPNVLSCTPTLEMGIDIGDLSTVILCNMPPAQSQFLQRAGRAGRKDGNALTLVIANSRPHDLYFYADPMDMIAGAVQPPKIFLNASAVLERQFVAYCLDSWIKHGIPETAIPDKVASCLNKLDDHPINAFPFNFLAYVQNNTTNRLNSFIQLFPELTQATRDALHDFAQGSGMKQSPMYVKVLKTFNDLKAQRDSVRSNIKDIDDLIEELAEKPKDSTYDDEIKELKSEKRALEEVAREMGDKNVFNFLSDEGLLPNYAFPEAGIVLKSILYRKEDPNNASNNSDSQKIVYEYHRSASAAISEFAPNNVFYADGHKMRIDQIDINSAKPDKWRLCPNCSYAEIDTTTKNKAECPRCHSTLWADNGQVRNMLKVQMVYSTTDYSRDLINDDSDDRTIRYYNRQLLVDVEENSDNVTAYQMKNQDFPFGFEYVKKATLREINFGENDLVGEKLTVSGREGVAKGFKICKYCGKIIPADSKGYNSKYHSKYCKSLKMSPSDQENSVEETLFLYREFSTEALRILIPATTLDEVSTESFVAAFMLGLKEKFGNIDHLRATISEVPVPETNERKQYLVIYDSVPGGTGYLKQFIAAETDNPDDNYMIQILQLSLSKMENCTCKDDPEKDGCYHCLYAYRQSGNIGNISRRRAMKLIKSILSGKKNLEKIDTISIINTNSLFDSELERRFVAAFQESSSGKHVIKTSSSIVNGKEGYILKINNVTWEIEPQVDLDEEYGVSVKCRPDFVLWPVTQKNKLPVAVFTDGFKYHKNKVDDDTLKREAIKRSGHFIVWTLSYQDVQRVFIDGEEYFTNTLKWQNMPSGNQWYQRMLNKYHAGDILPSQQTSFELLLRYLELDKAKEIFAGQAIAYAYSLLNSPKGQLSNRVAFSSWSSRVDEVVEATHFTDEIFSQDETFYGTWVPKIRDSHLTIFAGVSIASRKNNPNIAPDVVAILDDSPNRRTDSYESEWNGFWKFWNIMQFLPQHFVGVTETGLSDNVYLKLPIPSVDEMTAVDTAEETQVNANMAAWSKIIKEDMIYSDQEAIDFAQKAKVQNLPVPDEIGYEATDARGAVIATVEIAWVGQKIGYMTEEQLVDRVTLENEGWKILDKDSDIDKTIFGGEN